MATAVATETMLKLEPPAALNPIAPAFPVPEFEVQRVRLAPNPRARQLCSPPPVKTSTQQWYFTPGEAI